MKACKMLGKKSDRTYIDLSYLNLASFHKGCLHYQKFYSPHYTKTFIKKIVIRSTPAWYIQELIAADRMRMKENVYQRQPLEE